MGSIIKVASLGLIDPEGDAQRAGDDANRAQNAAREIADAQLKKSYGEQQEYLNPYLNAGKTALSNLASGNFMGQDPGYAFRLAEGNKALTNAAAARGMGNSGATLKALTRFGQDFASNEYQNAFNRQNQLANYGYGAAGNLSQFAGQYGQSIANNRMGIGNAQAANRIAQGNVNQQLIGQGMQLAGTALGSWLGSK